MASLLLPQVLEAGTRLTDQEVIEKIKSNDHVLRASYSSCSDEKLIRIKVKDREKFIYQAKCNLKEAEDACERHSVRATGDIEDWLVTVYDIKLHLLCLD